MNFVQAYLCYCSNEQFHGLTLIYISCCHWPVTALGWSQPLACYFHWPAAAIGLLLPLSSPCHWPIIVIGQLLLLACHCPWSVTVIGQSLSLVSHCHRPVAAIGLAICCHWSFSTIWSVTAISLSLHIGWSLLLASHCQ